MVWHDPATMPVRIGPRIPLRLFIAEYREKYGLTQAQLGERLDPAVSDVTVSRWETGKRRPDLDTLAAIAEAIHSGLRAEDMFRHPDTPSADELLRGQPDDVRDEAIKIIKAIRV